VTSNLSRGKPGLVLRSVQPDDAALLRELLYHAIYVPEGEAPPDPEITRRPELARYVEGWGRPGDLGLLALEARGRQPLGGAWLRLWPAGEEGYGYAGPEIPELSIAVLPGWRGAGVGTRLLAHLLAAAQGRYAAVSLSVSAQNPARRLYERFGFRIFEESGQALVMVRELSGGEAGPPLAQEVRAGLAAADGAPFAGWLVGDRAAWHAGRAVESSPPLLNQSSRVEVKWGAHPAGEERPGGWSSPAGALPGQTSLSVLVSGSLRLRFRDRREAGVVVEHTLQEAGDYVIWRDQVSHTWQALRACTVLTVRWLEEPRQPPQGPAASTTR
jgi:GNAT superfamily N-acetyltransferase